MKLSIITPLYNSAEYLRECAVCIKEQTMQDYEWLLIDDHGQDNSVELAKQLVEEFGIANKTRFLQTIKNSGPGEARNVGLRAAEGEYIVFLDSDDWVDTNSYELIVNAADKINADIVYYNGIMHENGKNTPLLTIPFKNQKQFLSHYVARITYCFRNSFIKQYNIEFPSTRAAEDTYFIAAAIMMSDKVCGVDDLLYHYRIHNTSVSHKFDRKRTEQKRISLKKLFTFAKEHNVWNKYKWQLRFIYLKKGILVPLLKGE
jgi:glycosyltransferase involved in cell wall biosynthesis